MDQTLIIGLGNPDPALEKPTTTWGRLRCNGSRSTRLNESAA